jgi:hypothetical protein
MNEEKKDKTARDIIEDVCNEICNHYCKYPDIWDEEEKGETMIDAVCSKDCPLNRL